MTESSLFFIVGHNPSDTTSLKITQMINLLTIAAFVLLLAIITLTG